MGVRPLLVCVVVLSVARFHASPALALDFTDAVPIPQRNVAVDRTLAEVAENESRWEDALSLYLKACTTEGSTPGLRERIRHCLRRSGQVRRHRDPLFHQFVSSLPVADALNLYAEVVGRLAALSADRDRATPARLFAFGVEEFDRAISDPEFCRRYLGKEELASSVRTAVQRAARHTVPVSPRDARLAVREVVRAAQTAGFRDGSVVVCEFLCGACAGIDEFTTFLPPSADSTPMSGPTVVDVGTVAMREYVGYLRLTSFRDSTSRELDEAMASLLARGARAVVLDVRGNAGGLFTSAIHVAERFLPGGIIVATQGPSPEFAGRVFTSSSGLAAYDMPIVLLVDAKTMSAAEVVAAAWKENRRAVLVGLPTYGKGVVQAPIPLQALDPPMTARNRSGLLVLTVANVFSPHGTSLHGTGVVPDVIVADEDSQFEAAVAKAVELLMNGGLPVPMPMSVVP